MSTLCTSYFNIFTFATGYIKKKLPSDEHGSVYTERKNNQKEN